MPTPSTVKIKVLPYLKKYMIAHSVNEQMPVYFENHHWFYLRLLPYIEKYNRTKKKLYPDDLMSFPNSNYIDLEIIIPYYSDKYNLRHKNYISIKNATKFNKEVKTIFYADLVTYLNDFKAKNASLRNFAIDIFLMYFDINEDDVNYDTIYRQMTRVFSSPLKYEDVKTNIKRRASKIINDLMVNKC